MELIKAIKKQRILKRDILVFHQYLYRDKNNANTYQLLDSNGCKILRYCKDRQQFASIPLENVPSMISYHSSGEIKDYIENFTNFNDEYKERKNTANPRLDYIKRIQVHTEWVNKKRIKEIETYINKQGE